MAYLRAISYEEARLAFFKVALTRAERSLDWAVKHIAELTLRSGSDCDICEEKGDIVSYYKDVVAMLERGADKGEFVSRKALLEAFENANADVVEEYEDGTRDWGFGMRNIREVIAGVPAADVEPVRPCAEVVEDPRTYPGESRANYGCTACRRILGTWKKGLTFEQLPNFCCWCGAEFTDGGTENEL